MKIGFIGAGQMGTGIAQRLIGAGHELAAWNRTKQKLEPLVAAGAHVAASPRAAAEGADVLITMLADDKATEAVVLEGDDAAANGLREGGIHLAMGTISPRCATHLAEAHSQRGQRLVSAPVLGRPDAAAAGQLVILTAGAAEAIAACAPIFEATARKTYPFGAAPAQANVAKLGMNFTIVSMLEVLGEALAMTEAHGIDSEQFVDIVSSLYGSPILTNYGKKIAKGDFANGGFGLKLGQKDVRFILETAEAKNVSMPIASVLRDRFLDALAAGAKDDDDWSAISRVGR